MDMGRLIGFMALKVKAVRPASQDRRHAPPVPLGDGLVGPEPVNLDPFKRPWPGGLAGRDALTEP